MILVAGSTGSVGSRLVPLLLEAGEQVRAIVPPGEDDWADWPDVETITADFDDPVGVANAAKGADRMFILVPPTPEQVARQHHLIEAAAHCEYVVKLSAFDTAADTALTMGRWHHAGEVELARTSIPYTILRPQYFMQNLFASPRLRAEGTLPTFIDPTTPVGMVDVLDVAATAAALLVAGAPPQHGPVVVPTGPRAVTVDEVAAELTRVLGHPIAVDHLRGDAARGAMRARGLPDWHIEDVLYICTTASSLVTDCLPAVVGRPARDVSVVVDQLAVDNDW
jgi:uncharacterized protein YbjT (DUF2867 family)